MKKFTVVKEKPNIVKFSDDKEVFGEVEEITSRAVGAERANVARVTLWGADVLHAHKEAEETYICQEGKGELFLDGKITDFVPGVRAIIAPGTLHAARPKEEFGKLVLLCVASPAFSPDDVYEDPRGRKWTVGPYFKGQNAAECGCYFPDVVRLGDDFEKKRRILYCVNHGEYEIPLPAGVKKEECQGEKKPIPSEEWREQERQRIKKEEMKW